METFEKVDDPEKVLHTRILDLQSHLVASKKLAAELIGLDRGINTDWRSAVHDCATRSRATIGAARSGDVQRAELLFRERESVWRLSVARRQEAHSMREAVNALKSTLRRMNDTIELLKRRKNVLIARRAGGGHAFQAQPPPPSSSQETRAPTEQIILPLPFVLDPPLPTLTTISMRRELPLLEQEAARLDAENDRLTRLHEELQGAWPAILARLAQAQ